jgi:hypothetical protein
MIFFPRALPAVCLRPLLTAGPPVKLDRTGFAQRNLTDLRCCSEFSAADANFIVAPLRHLFDLF